MRGCSDPLHQRIDTERKSAIKRKAAAGRHTYGTEARKAKEEIADYLKREPTPRFYG